MDKQNYIEKAMKYYQKLDYELAGYYIYKAILTEPQNPELLYASANIFSKLYDFDSCLKQLLEVQKIDSSYPNLNESLRIVQAKLKQRVMNQHYG